MRAQSRTAPTAPVRPHADLLRRRLRQWAAACAESVALYGRLVGAQVRSQMQYRTSFLLLAVGSFAANVIEFAAVVILFRQISQLAGWSLYEIGLLYGLSAVAFATAEFIGSSLDDFQLRIVQGTFDRVLTRPRGAFLQVLAEELALRRLGRVAQGVLVLILALQGLAIAWTPDKLAVLALALLSGTAIFFAVFVLGAAFCFWTVQGKEATHILSYGGNMLTSYPLEVYEGWLRRFVTFIVPLAFVTYYPALYLLDRPDPLGLPGWVRLGSPVAALLFGILARWAWTSGVRRYQSTGS